MDAYEIIEQHWPYDGPHSAETVINAADTLVGLVRYMNNATRSPGRLNASQLWRVLVELASVAAGMDQLLRQLAATAQRVATEVANQPGWYDDRHDRQAIETALHVWSELNLATVALSRFDSRLRDAAAEASHLGYQP